MVESTNAGVAIAKPMTNPDIAKDEIVEEAKVDKVQYTCRKCRCLLFDEDAIQEHTSKVKKFTGVKAVSH